jgi:Flp pilus assembly protein TadB
LKRDIQGKEYLELVKERQAKKKPKKNKTKKKKKKKKKARQKKNKKKAEKTNQTKKKKRKKNCIACPCFFWSLYCLSMFLLVVVLPVHVSFGLCIVCPCFFWSLYCLSMTGNTTTKRNMDRQYNGQKKHGQAIQLPKET